MNKRFIKYLIVGGSSALLEVIIFSFLRILSFDLSLANIVAVATATLYNFFLNRGWSFAAGSKLKRSFLLYLILFFFNLAFSTTAIQVIVSLGFIEVLAKLLTMVLITIWNYVLYRKVIFK